MNHPEHRACAATAAVTLLAIAGFCCTVFDPPAERAGGWHTIEARAEPEAGDAHSTGEAK